MSCDERILVMPCGGIEREREREKEIGLADAALRRRKNDRVMAGTVERKKEM